MTIKKEVKALLKENERCDIDASKILKVYTELMEGDDDEVLVSSQDVYDKLIELHPEKKCFNNCKKVSKDEFIDKF